MKLSKITINAIIQAKPSIVWDYYTNPNHITKWNFASNDWECPSASNDLRVGGKYIAKMQAKDGSFGFDFEAIYDEISIGKYFIYTLTDGRKVKVTFKQKAAGTEATIEFDAETENPIEMQRDGWQAILNNFKKYVESQY